MSREFVLVPKFKYERLLQQVDKPLSSPSIQQGGLGDQTLDQTTHSNRASHIDQDAPSDQSAPSDKPSDDNYFLYPQSVSKTVQPKLPQRSKCKKQFDKIKNKNSLTESILSASTKKLHVKRTLSEMNFLSKKPSRQRKKIYEGV